MTREHFEAGDRVDAISVAGAAFDLYRHGPIFCEVFTLDACYLVPILISTARGSGTLDAFLDELRRALPDRPILFVNVINQRLRPRLLARGFGLWDPDDAAVAAIADEVDALTSTSRRV